MRIFYRIMLFLACVLSLAVPAEGQTRALLVACSDFISQPDLGNAISGNLHMIGSALLGAGPVLAGLSIEDGTIGAPEQLSAAILHAFEDSSEEDLSILYLCTHGVLSSADDEQVYLLLGNGESEYPLSADALYDQLSGIQGDKLLILDACYSGALLGRGLLEQNHLSPTAEEPQPFLSPFLADSSMHVLTSASGSESSWYYDSDKLITGAVSYFASALSSGLGLYGSAEADLNGDGAVSLREMHSYLRASVPSSACQLLTSRPDAVFLPTAGGAMLSRPLTDFSYGASLLTAADPVLDFSFTVTKETAVQYRLIEHKYGAWNWSGAQTFGDAGENGGALLPGRHSRSLTLPTVSPEDGGYLMLQVFSVSGDELLLCSERLIAVQPSIADAALSLHVPQVFDQPGLSELPIAVTLGAPAEITLSVYDTEDRLVVRLSQSELTRPSDENVLHAFWNGRDTAGNIASDGLYTVLAEALIGFSRVKTAKQVTVYRGALSP